MATDSSALLKDGAATPSSTDGARKSGSARTMKALSVESPKAEAQTKTSLQRLADNCAARPCLVRIICLLVALALVAAGAILDMKATQNDAIELVMTAVRQDGLALEFAGTDFQDNKDVVLAAVRQIGSAVKFASDGLQGDRDVALTAARHSHGSQRVMKMLAKKFGEDEEVQLAAVRSNFRELSNAPMVKNNLAAVLDVVRLNGEQLQAADPGLKSNHDVVLEAVRQNGEALKYVPKSDPLRKDSEVVLEAVRSDGAALAFADTSMKNDREVVLAAVRQRGHALQFASEDLKEDTEVVMAAVFDRGDALKFAKGEAKQKVEHAAIFRDNCALPYAAEKVQQNPGDAAGFWQRLRNGQPQSCEELLSTFKNVKDEPVKKKMELAALRHNGECLKDLQHLMNDEEAVFAAVRSNGLALQHAGPGPKKERAVVLAAVHQNGLALGKSDLKDDKGYKDVVLAAVRQNGLALKHAKSFKNDLEVVLAAVRQSGKALQHADEKLKNDRDVVLAAVRHDMPISLPQAKKDGGHDPDQALKHAKKFQNDRDVVFEALRSNGRALEHVKVTEITATWERTIIAGVIVLVPCIAFVVLLVFTPHEASSDTADPSERV